MAPHLRHLDHPGWGLGGLSGWYPGWQWREPGSLSPHQTTGRAGPGPGAGTGQRVREGLRLEEAPWEWAQVPALLETAAAGLFGMGSPVPLLAMNNLAPVKWFISHWAPAPGREMKGQEVRSSIPVGMSFGRQGV